MRSDIHIIKTKYALKKSNIILKYKKIKTKKIIDTFINQKIIKANIFIKYIIIIK